MTHTEEHLPLSSDSDVGNFAIEGMARQESEGNADVGHVECVRRSTCWLLSFARISLILYTHTRAHTYKHRT